MMRLVRNIKNKTFDRMFPGLAYRHKKKRWQQSWSESEFAPNWRPTQMPPEIIDAVESGWWPKGESVLDIGCGSGEISHFLAEQGYTVLGVDFAKGAIDLAKKQFADFGENLGFDTIDICQPGAIASQYDILLDRGCLHGIPEGFAPVYVKNVTDCTRPGAKFLLLFATNKGKRKPEDQENQAREVGRQFIEKILSDSFDILDVQPMLFDRGEQHAASGIAVRMVRKGG